jgi:hypothetical protein
MLVEARLTTVSQKAGNKPANLAGAALRSARPDQLRELRAIVNLRIIATGANQSAREIQVFLCVSLLASQLLPFELNSPVLSGAQIQRRENAIIAFPSC